MNVSLKKLEFQGCDLHSGHGLIVLIYNKHILINFLTIVPILSDHTSSIILESNVLINSSFEVLKTLFCISLFTLFNFCPTAPYTSLAFFPGFFFTSVVIAGSFIF